MVIYIVTDDTRYFDLNYLFNFNFSGLESLFLRGMLS